MASRLLDKARGGYYSLNRVLCLHRDHSASQFYRDKTQVDRVVQESPFVCPRIGFQIFLLNGLPE